jgi:hypothetical protein
VLNDPLFAWSVVPWKATRLGIETGPGKEVRVKSAETAIITSRRRFEGR